MFEDAAIHFFPRKGLTMKLLAMLSGAAAIVLLAGTGNRAEGQFGFGGLRAGGMGFGRMGFGGMGFGGMGFGGITSFHGPFGVGAVGVRGPFGGGVGVVGAGIAPVMPVAVAPVAVPVPVPVVQQTVLNPAAVPTFTYSAAYLARIPAGYATLEIAHTPYYYTPVLPVGSVPVVLGGVNMFTLGGVYYQPYFLGGHTVYVVVEH